MEKPDEGEVITWGQEQPAHTPGKRTIECTLNDAELIEAVNKWNSDLCQGRRKWMMSIPAKPDEDVDLLIGEMSYRFKQLAADNLALREENGRLKADVEGLASQNNRFRNFSLDEEALRAEVQRKTEALKELIEWCDSMNYQPDPYYQAKAALTTPTKPDDETKRPT